MSHLPESHISSLLPRKLLLVLWVPASELLLHDLPRLPFPTLDHVPFLSIRGALWQAGGGEKGRAGEGGGFFPYDSCPVGL